MRMFRAVPYPVIAYQFDENKPLNVQKPVKYCEHNKQYYILCRKKRRYVKHGDYIVREMDKAQSFVQPKTLFERRFQEVKA